MAAAPVGPVLSLSLSTTPGAARPWTARNRRFLPLSHPPPPSSSSSSCKASKITAMSVTKRSTATYWTSINSDIDAHLSLSLPKNPPPTVHDAMRRLISAAPITMAPALCIAACELVGGRRDRAFGAACAVRLIHSAFCAHRDLLGMPNPAAASAAVRDNVKLLTADGLLPLCYEIVAAGLEEEGDPERLLRVIVEISDAMGSRGIVEGHYEESLCGGTCEGGSVERACEKKEGRLYACAAACGAILGGGGEEAVEAMRRYGMYVGTMHGLLSLSSSSYGGAHGGGGKRRSEVAAAVLRSPALSALEGFGVGDEDEILSLVDVLWENDSVTPV